jgi:hypothetical protein
VGEAVTLLGELRGEEGFAPEDLDVTPPAEALVERLEILARQFLRGHAELLDARLNHSK